MGRPRRPSPPPPPPPPPKPAPVKVMTPTKAEVDQSGDAYAVRTKRRGRSQTILTGPEGVQDDQNFTLGRRSLLGR
jgi:hypothetical protein|tara:strand:- start:66 stop:293 length:228 start_codon:yes stop_codon:yes gene_type:complete